MRCGLCFILMLMCRNWLSAQRVIYSPNLHDYRYTGRQMAGKAGAFYWLEKEKSSSSARGPDLPQQSFFDVFDRRLNKIRECAGASLPAGTEKEYLVSGVLSFDQLLIVGAAGKTQLLLKRFSADGGDVKPSRTIDSLPFREDAGSFLLLHSEDHRRLALIVFESAPDAPRRLHTLLFDQDWNLLSRTMVNANTITAPCIQDDFISYPAESYDNLPIKLADSGEWFMSSASTTSRNYNLYHFFPGGTYRLRELRLSPEYTMQDIALSLDEDGRGVRVAILSAFRKTTLKKLQTVHYADRRTAVDFDSAFYFNINAGSIVRKNSVKDFLLPLPSGGYMFFTEYGRNEEPPAVPVDPLTWETAYLFAGYTGDDPTAKPPGAPGYAGQRGLSYNPSLYSRGDMRMFYFPGQSGDSTWSGLIHESQNTGANWPALSYTIMPEKNKLLFIYNATESDFARSTAVDLHGNPADEPLVFSEFKRSLNFQRGQRIGPAEIAVPYLDQPGFAIIRAEE